MEIAYLREIRDHAHAAKALCEQFVALAHVRKTLALANARVAPLRVRRTSRSSRAPPLHRSVAIGWRSSLMGFAVLVGVVRSSLS